MHQCILCMGSNVEGESLLKTVRDSLIHYFGPILFSDVMETEAIGDDFQSPFYNQVVILHSNFSIDDTKMLCKRIEKEHGRLPEDKSNGIVKIDVDLIKYDDTCLKEKDLALYYVQQGLEQIRDNKKKSV